MYETRSIMKAILEYLKEIYREPMIPEEYVPWIYAVIIVAVTVLILSTAIGIQP